MAKADMKITFDEDGLEFVAKLTDRLEAVCDRLENACDRMERMQGKPDGQGDLVTITVGSDGGGTNAGRQVLDALDRLKEGR